MKGNQGVVFVIILLIALAVFGVFGSIFLTIDAKAEQTGLDFAISKLCNKWRNTDCDFYEAEFISGDDGETLDTLCIRSFDPMEETPWNVDTHAHCVKKCLGCTSIGTGDE